MARDFALPIDLKEIEPRKPSEPPRQPFFRYADNTPEFRYIRQHRKALSDGLRIVGGEPWMRQTTFDVRAKGAEPIAYPAVHKMIERMLTERFRLHTHMESRPFDVYIARLTRPDGVPGEWLVPTAPECVEAREKGLPRPSSCERLARAREAEGGRSIQAGRCWTCS